MSNLLSSYRIYCLAGYVLTQITKQNIPTAGYQPTSQD
jgi:hypothetical protein